MSQDPFNGEDFLNVPADTPISDEVHVAYVEPDGLDFMDIAVRGDHRVSHTVFPPLPIHDLSRSR